MQKKLQILAGVIIGLVIVAGIAFMTILGYSSYKSWEIDYRNHQAMVQIIQYNLQQGKLLALPQQAAPPVAPAAPQSNVPPPSDPHPAAKK